MNDLQFLFLLGTIIACTTWIGIEIGSCLSTLKEILSAVENLSADEGDEI